MWAMLQTLYQGQSMRHTTNGVLVNVTQRGLFENTFRAQYGLSPAQYANLTQLFDRGAAGPVFAASEAHLQIPIPGVPGYAGRYFAVDKTRCCDGTLHVTWMSTTVFERARTYRARHVVKRCVVAGGCGAVYYHNKKTVKGTVGEQPCRWHLFYPWVDGVQPLFISNKSGRSVVSSALLTDAVLQQRTLRYVKSKLNPKGSVEFVYVPTVG